MKKRTENRKTEIILGTAAGVLYSIYAWGIDAWTIAMHNGSMGWIKLAIGIVPVTLLFMMVALLSASMNNLLLKMVLWMITATGLSYLIAYTSFNGVNWILQKIYPELSKYINYLLPEGIASRLFIIIVMTNVLFIIGGLFIDLAAENIQKATGILGMLIPVFICLTFFAGAGFVADSNFNTELRQQIIAVDDQIITVAQLDVNSMTEREERMARRFTKLNVDLNGPRKLLIGNFDVFFSQVQILIDFNGTWASCLALNGRVGNCELIE